MTKLFLTIFDHAFPWVFSTVSDLVRSMVYRAGTNDEWVSG